MSEIVMLPVERLIPHPDNPRKNVGDVTELAESIKANGILQNLTVVPYKSIVHGNVMNGMYTVIIGHRRLAAAKLAGLNSVPCVIAEMTEEEQLSTMLTENMQRTDLTVYEQAKAFRQLQMDLGMSVQEISEKSGFSESTVRKRTKLAELDEAAFKKACDRGATLFDFAELDKIEDPKAKNEVLSAIGTNNFKNVLKQKLDIQKTKKNFEKWTTQLDAFATRIEKDGYVDGKYVRMNYYRNYGSWSNKEDIVKPEDADTVRYFYKVSDLQISVYKEAVLDKESEAAALRRKEISERDEAAWSEMKEIGSRHKSLRRDFVMNYSSAKSALPVILSYLADAILMSATEYRQTLAFDLSEMLGIPFDKGTKLPDEDGYEIIRKERKEYMLLVLTYLLMETGSGYASHDWNKDLQRFVINHRGNRGLDELYCFLEDIGYHRSDEEIKIASGEHQLFFKG